MTFFSGVLFGDTTTAEPSLSVPPVPQCYNTNVEFANACQTAYRGVQNGARCFFLPPGTVDWADAFTQCASYGGTLASIHSSSEWGAITTYLQVWVALAPNIPILINFRWGTLKQRFLDRLGRFAQRRERCTEQSHSCTHFVHRPGFVALVRHRDNGWSESESQEHIHQNASRRRYFRDKSSMR